MQRIAKLVGIKANAKSVVIAEQLQAMVDEASKDTRQGLATQEKEAPAALDEHEERAEEPELADLSGDGKKDCAEDNDEPVPMDIDAEAPAMDAAARKKAVLAARSERAVRKAAKIRQERTLATTSIAHHRQGPKSVDRPTCHRGPLFHRNGQL